MVTAKTDNVVCRLTTIIINLSFYSILMKINVEKLLGITYYYYVY